MITSGLATVEAGEVEDNTITTAKIQNLAVTEQKIATGAVTSGKIADGSIGYAKTKSEVKPGSGAGTTLALLTAAFGSPSTLSDGFIASYKDTTAGTGGNYIITVEAGVFQISAKSTPVTA
jgi:hypothetical protein